MRSSRYYVWVMLSVTILTGCSSSEQDDIINLVETATSPPYEHEAAVIQTDKLRTIDSCEVTQTTEFDHQNRYQVTFTETRSCERKIFVRESSHETWRLEENSPYTDWIKSTVNLQLLGPGSYDIHADTGLELRCPNNTSCITRQDYFTYTSGNNDLVPRAISRLNIGWTAHHAGHVPLSDLTRLRDALIQYGSS